MVRLYRECRPVEWALREVDVDYFVESITFEESDLEPVTGHPPLARIAPLTSSDNGEPRIEFGGIISPARSRASA